MRSVFKVLLIMAVVLAVGLSGGAPASADLVLNPNLCQGNNVGSCPQANWPFIIATFDGTTTVSLTMEASLEPTLLQFVSTWWFNLDPSVVPSGAVLTITQTSGDLAVERIRSDNTANSPGPWVVTIEQDAQVVNGGGAFDLGFNFFQGPDDLIKFDNFDVLTFDITCSGCVGTFDFNAFGVLSTGGGHTPYIAAPGSPDAGELFVSPFRTIASINPEGHFIAGVGQPVPEPATLLLVGAGLVGIGAVARKLRQ